MISAKVLKFEILLVLDMFFRGINHGTLPYKIGMPVEE